jgi:Transposase DDE domain/Insertion element 4 transposase N-terminal
MTRQGRCSLLADGQGRILDRLAGLEKVITPDQIQQALLATDRLNVRACPLTHEIMLWVVVAMGLLTELPIRQVFKHARRLCLGVGTPGRSSLCQARQRLGVAPVRHLFHQVVRPLATPQTPGAFYQGLRLVAVDGTTENVPDSDANAAAFSRADGGRGPGAWPQARKVSLVELGTHVELAMAIGGWQNSEQELVRDIVDRIPTDALVLYDRGFFGYSLWQRLDSRGLKLLVRVPRHVVLEPIRVLSDGSFLAKIYARSRDRERDRNGIVVRVMEYTHHDSQRVGCGEDHRLMTNLLDEIAYPALTLICLYHERWEIEVVFDEQKTHQDPRRASKPANVRSETPEGVRQELYALSLGHFITRALMFEAATQANLDPDRLSFTGCLQVLRRALPECDSRSPQTMNQWYAVVLAAMQAEEIPARRNRINPRVIKQKMSKWPKKRPKHREIPPLRKRFVDTVVMLN